MCIESSFSCDSKCVFQCAKRLLCDVIKKAPLRKKYAALVLLVW